MLSTFWLLTTILYNNMIIKEALLLLNVLWRDIVEVRGYVEIQIIKTSQLSFLSFCRYFFVVLSLCFEVIFEKLWVEFDWDLLVII